MPIEAIQRRIMVVREQKVMLDADLAELYGVETRVLVQAVKRNIERFPRDFMFQLSKAEFDFLRSQSEMSRSWGGRRTRPYAFSEQGVAMLSGVLRSRRAVAMNIEIMRAFVELRRLLASRDALERKIAELERKHAQHDKQLKAIFETLRQLMAHPIRRRKYPVGFALPQGNAKERDRAVVRLPRSK